MLDKIKEFFIPEEDYDDEYEEEATNKLKKEDVKDIKKNRKGALSSIVTKRPSNYDEILEVADYLKQNYPVILDLNRNTPEDINNIMDFLGGVVYAIDGITVEVSVNTYMFLPYGIEVESDEDNRVSYLFNNGQNKENAQNTQKQSFNNNVAQQARPTGSQINPADYAKKHQDVIKLK